jgi:hypothetical protein
MQRNQFEIVIKLFVIVRSTGEMIQVHDFDNDHKGSNLEYRDFVIKHNGQYYKYKLYEQDNVTQRYHKNIGDPIFMDWFFETEVREVNYL